MASALPQLPASLRFASVRIQYDGAPDSLMGQVESREQQGRLVVSSSLVNEGDGRAGAGAHPWQVDHGTNSFLFLTNMGDKPSRIGFQVQAKGVDYYLTNLKLQPHETRAIGMRELRDQQQEDFRKNKIPADATEGSVRWVRLDNVPVMGRLVVLKGQEHEIVSVGKRAGGTANGGGQAPFGSVNFICQDCFCPCPAGLQNLDYSVGCDVLNVISGQICGISFLGDYVDCNGNSSFFDDTLSSSVSSSDTSVATIANSASPASLTGINPGSADVTASFADNTYPFAPNSCSPVLYTVRVVPHVRVLRLVATVINPPVSGDGDASISGQMFTLQIEAIDPSTGQRVTGFNRAVSIGFPVSQLIQGESVSPNPVTLNQGVGQAQVTLKVIDSNPGYSCCRTYSLNGSLAPQAVGYVKIWFNVISTDEGLVGGTTAYGHIIVANDHFVALPSGGLSGVSVLLRNGPNTATTLVQDKGPWFPHSVSTTQNPCVGGDDTYWNTTGIPRVLGVSCDSNNSAIDLADGTFTDLGNPTQILWRFQ